MINEDYMQEVHADKVLMLAIGNNDYISYNKLFDRYYGRLCQYVKSSSSPAVATG